MISPLLNVSAFPCRDQADSPVSFGVHDYETHTIHDANRNVSRLAIVTSVVDLSDDLSAENPGRIDHVDAVLFGNGETFPLVPLELHPVRSMVIAQVIRVAPITLSH